MKNYNEFKQHIIDTYPQEGCGLIVDDIFIPIKNIAEDPCNFFQMDNEDVIQHKITAVLHSHCNDKYPTGYDPRTPSYEDMLSQEAIDVPFGIVHCDGENITDILWFGTDEITELLGRPYISNVYDCATLALDYYRLHYKKTFSLYPRPPDWVSWNPHFITQVFDSYGLFYEVDRNKIRVGDILLFSIGSRLINHVGIVTGEDTFIHHLYNRKSCEDKISKWDRQWVKSLRHR